MRTHSQIELKRRANSNYQEKVKQNQLMRNQSENKLKDLEILEKALLDKLSDTYRKQQSTFLTLEDQVNRSRTLLRVPNKW